LPGLCIPAAGRRIPLRACFIPVRPRYPRHCHRCSLPHGESGFVPPLEGKAQTKIEIVAADVGLEILPARVVTMKRGGVEIAILRGEGDMGG